MTSAASFQDLASGDNSHALETLAFMADFYHSQPQASTAMEIDIGESVPESHSVMSAYNALNTILSETEVDPSATSFVEAVFNL